jgi:hypothetical protein
VVLKDILDKWRPNYQKIFKDIHKERAEEEIKIIDDLENKFSVRRERPCYPVW